MSEKENIKNLLPPPAAPKLKTERYVSKYAANAGKEKFEMGATKRPRATMGLPNERSHIQPCDFLRKHQNFNWKPSTEKWVKMKTKPPVPTQIERPVMGLVTDKNYVVGNAVDAILSRPPKKAEQVRYVKKKGYGKLPKFYRDVRSEPQSSDVSPSQKQDDGWTQMPSEDRQQLLRHLKNKWADVNCAYQKLTFTLDTPAKKKRKETLEDLLTKIEKDIQLLESSEMIVVYDNL